ncbi:MAG: thioredoxin family protein [Thiobacillaceae bacterium]
MRFKELTEFDFLPTLAASTGVSIVMFSGPDCGSCRRLEELLPYLLRDRAQYLYKVDVQRSTALARAYEVFHLPSLFAFLDGHYHGPLQAEPTLAGFSHALNTLLSGPPQEEP